MTSTHIFALPTLKGWAEWRLTALLEAKTEEDFDKAFDTFVASDAQVTVNGAHLSRAEYKQTMRDSGALASLATSATIHFDGAVEHQAGEGERAGLVGVLCEVTVNEKIRVFGAPAQYKVIFSINLTVKQDASLPKPKPPAETFDGRRAFVVNQVMTRMTVPIHPPIPVQPPINPQGDA